MTLSTSVYFAVLFCTVLIKLMTADWLVLVFIVSYQPVANQDSPKGHIRVILLVLVQSGLCVSGSNHYNHRYISVIK